MTKNKIIKKQSKPGRLASSKTKVGSEPGRVKIALLLKNEIERIIDNLVFRKSMLFEIWSKWRNRAPFVSALSSGYFDLPLKDLFLLSEAVIREINGFYRKLDDIRFYVAYTEDMPTTMEVIFDRDFETLRQCAEKAIKLLQLEIGDTDEGK